MPKENAPSTPTISNWLSAHYNIKAVSLARLSLGADIYASTYKVQTDDQKTYFLKLKHKNHHDISMDIIELLQHADLQQIICPIKTIHGKTSQSTGDFNLIVYPFIQGEDGFHRPLTDDQWKILGKALKKVHEVSVPFSIQNRLRKETYSPRWREAVRSIYAHFETLPIADEIAQELYKLMKEKKLEIHQLLNRAEELSQTVQHLSPPLVLCHSDIHAGNVLIDEEHVIYIVDWDEPMMAPKERDLMFIGGGVGNVWNRPHEEKQFYEGYGKTEINSKILSYYRHERIVEDIAIYSQELLLTAAGGENRSTMYQHFVDMFAPQGVIEIAFKTGKA